MTKFLIIGDLHGAMPRIYDTDFDAIIAPGDISSDKELRKISDWRVKSWGKRKTLHSEIIEYITKNIGKKKYGDMEKRSLDIGNRILRKLDRYGKPIFFVPGNWDQAFDEENDKDSDDPYLKSVGLFQGYANSKTPERLVRGVRNLVDVHFKNVEFEGINIIGWGVSSTPEKLRIEKFRGRQRKRLREEYQKLLNRLEKPYSKRNKKLPTLFLSHNVPHNTKLDKILKSDSPVYGKHYGSTVTRDFIEKHKPLICVGSHMHEYLGKDRIGKTVCLNAGFGGEVNTILEIENGKIKSIKWITHDHRRSVNKRVGR
jgi:Icc-related predicted phosphoesterase